MKFLGVKLKQAHPVTIFVTLICSSIRTAKPIGESGKCTVGNGGVGIYKEK